MGQCRVAEINHRALSYYPRLARLKAYCIAHFDEEISLEQAARIAALERTYFSNYFHRKVGVCFGCWLTSLRIKQTRSSMESSDLSITRIAFNVGYKNLWSFERAFRRCTGMSARQYKVSVKPD
jgi:transcriptional regulator GlxA family with amidase domain